MQLEPLYTAEDFSFAQRSQPPRLYRNDNFLWNFDLPNSLLLQTIAKLKIFKKQQVMLNLFQHPIRKIDIFIGY